MTVLVSPSLDEARGEVVRGLKARRLIVMVATCAVTYSGRTGSQLGQGERLVVVKGDGCVLVHRGQDYQPVNWQPAGCVLQAFVEGENLVVKAVRTTPLESLNIKINRVDFLGTFQLKDEAEFLLHASEEDMQRAILLEPDIIEPGLKVVDLEKKVVPGFVDVYGVDNKGNTVVIEIKKDPAGFPAVKQLAEYLKHLQPAAGRRLRPVIVAPGLAKGVQSQLARMGIEYRQLSLQKCVEIIEKHSKSDQQALGGWLQ